MGVDPGGMGDISPKIEVVDGLYYHPPNISQEVKKNPKIDIF